jgi:hypothetical protein
MVENISPLDDLLMLNKSYFQAWCTMIKTYSCVFDDNYHHFNWIEQLISNSDQDYKEKVMNIKGNLKEKYFQSINIDSRIFFATDYIGISLSKIITICSQTNAHVQ